MKGQGKIRKERYEWNVSILRKLHKSLGLEVYEHCHTHLRIVGKKVIDYWPSTGRAWEVGSMDRTKIMSVEAVCDWASRNEYCELLPEGAQMHMDSLVMR